VPGDRDTFHPHPTQRWAPTLGFLEISSLWRIHTPPAMSSWAAAAGVDLHFPSSLTASLIHGPVPLSHL
jgi:hypothetical protein